jgi:hypothetical protein
MLLGSSQVIEPFHDDAIDGLAAREALLDGSVEALEYSGAGTSGLSRGCGNRIQREVQYLDIGQFIC